MAFRRRPVAVLVLALVVGSVPSARAESPSPRLREQIRALAAEKHARTSAEQKLDSALLYALRSWRGEAPVPGVPSLRAESGIDAAGWCSIELRGRRTKRLLRQMREEGASMRAGDARPGLVRARVPVRSLLRLAALPEVDAIRMSLPAETRMLDVSEGDVAHRADELRQTLGVDGTGITIGVLSDGVDALPALIASGDLPPVTVLAGQAGTGSEGTAMLEIVHDLAPGADLAFATAFNGEPSFANNILALRAAGADVIVDDVFYLSEPVFQDGVVANAVDVVAADGALYFSSAGNSGNLDAGTAGVWEGDFADDGLDVHTFAPGAVSNLVTLDSPSFFTLQWSDPFGASGNDYDLLLVDATEANVLAASTNLQSGFGFPLEFIDSQAFEDAGNRLVIVRDSGAVRFLHLNTNRGRLGIGTDGQTSGHAAARGALGVAAVDVRTAGPGGVFDGTETVEFFSSDGPRRVFFEADGSPIGAGPPTDGGGELRAKPDLSAADCVSTATPGFAIFCGTSAAAPHAAALAGLLLELGQPQGLGPTQVRDVLLGTALDLGAPGPDRNAGAGLLDGAAAGVAVAAGPCGNGIDDDGDGAVDADDPGCIATGDFPENPPCQDGIDNDQDGTLDFDGGAAANGGVPLGAPDPQCSEPFLGREDAMACGLGFELGPVLLALLAWRRRRR